MKRTEARQALRDALSNCSRIKINNTLHLFPPALTAEFHAKAKKAMSRGGQVTWEDGRTEWIDYEAILDTEKTGGDQYTTDKADRVACIRRLHTKTESGVTTRTLGRAFVSWEKAFE